MPPQPSFRRFSLNNFKRGLNMFEPDTSDHLWPDCFQEQLGQCAALSVDEVSDARQTETLGMAVYLLVLVSLCKTDSH